MTYNGWPDAFVARRRKRYPWAISVLIGSQVCEMGLSVPFDSHISITEVEQFPNTLSRSITLYTSMWHVHNPALEDIITPHIVYIMTSPCSIRKKIYLLIPMTRWIASSLLIAESITPATLSTSTTPPIILSSTPRVALVNLTSLSHSVASSSI